MDYTKLTDVQVREIRSHWRGEERLSKSSDFSYKDQLNKIEAEASRRGLSKY